MRCRRPCNTRFRLAGCAFAGRESNPLARDEGFLAHLFPPSRTSQHPSIQARVAHDSQGGGGCTPLKAKVAIGDFGRASLFRPGTRYPFPLPGLRSGILSPGAPIRYRTGPPALVFLRP
ncbi:MAG: hypothetical protein OXH99_16300, partial [Bryobacterales bacterium]|nr:hypothetical protein [Bryobacterales bacterium]